tara:strand:- start:2350 stop:2574 length:225 start_codon:yes stop_codon:yes gene_type:complete
MVEANSVNPDLVTKLVTRLHELYGTSPSDLERMCWSVVHEHHHDAMPSEYDIREVDEDLYLAVLTEARLNGEGG